MLFTDANKTQNEITEKFKSTFETSSSRFLHVQLFFILFSRFPNLC